MTVALGSCMLITLPALSYIFVAGGELTFGAERPRAAYLRERKDAVYDNLRDLNFEYRAGKIAAIDYRSLKISMQDEAATLLAELARLEPRAIQRKEKP